MDNSLGKCYYCQQDVIHDKQYDYGAFTKKWDNKNNCYILKNVWHMACYYDSMRKYDSIIRRNKKEVYTQLSLFD